LIPGYKFAEYIRRKIELMKESVDLIQRRASNGYGVGNYSMIQTLEQFMHIHPPIIKEGSKSMKHV
jgi:hypothetical protein